MLDRESVKATWPSGLRRQNQDLVFRGVSSNLTVVKNLFQLELTEFGM